MQTDPQWNTFHQQILGLSSTFHANLPSEVTQPLSMRLAQRKKKTPQAKLLDEKKPRDIHPPTTQNTSPLHQNSSRYMLGFSPKLSHAPLQIHLPKNHKMAALSLFFQRV